MGQFRGKPQINLNEDSSSGDCRQLECRGNSSTADSTQSQWMALMPSASYMSGFQQTTTSRSRRKPLIQVPGQGPPKDYSNVRYAPSGSSWSCTRPHQLVRPAWTRTAFRDLCRGCPSSLANPRFLQCAFSLPRLRDVFCERRRKETTCTK